MNENTAEGTLDKLTGKIKEAVGHLTGNHEMEAEGKLDQVKGSAQKTAGDAQDVAEDAKDRLKKAFDAK